MASWLDRVWPIKTVIEGEIREFEDDVEREYVRAMARHAADMLEQGRIDSMSDARTTGRWMLASLLTLNGGGALAVATSDSLLANAAQAGPWFVAGCVFAVLSGLASVLSFVVVAAPTGSAVASFRYDEGRGVMSQISYTLACKLTRLSTLLMVTNIIVGAVSLGCFVLGCAYLM